MKFIPQRGGLAESMKEMVEVNSFQELADHLGKSVDDLRIEEYDNRPDNRIGWPLSTIVMMKYPDGTWCPCGYTDSLTFSK
jgi:hypothetical protein